MSDLFASAPGTVAVVPQEYVLPGRIKIAGHEPQAFLVSGADYDQEVSQQFQPSLDRAHYIYVFGDQMGKIDVNGLAFLALCGQGGGGDAAGFKEVLELYEKNRSSTREEPVDVSIGSQVISGFLGALRVKAITAADDPTGLRYEFTFRVFTLPKE